MISIAKNPSAAREKAKNLRNALAERFSWIACAQQLANYLDWNILTNVSSPVRNIPDNTIVVLPSATRATFVTGGKIKNFRDSYLLSEVGDLPFGGRDREFRHLNAWLRSDSDPNRLLITGPTGRGKSALLVQWTEHNGHAPAKDGWHVVFVPISMRFNTNRPSVFYELLASHLAHILDIALQLPSGDPEGFYTGIISTLLQQLAETKTKILIVIDGIDEALDQRFDTQIFPVLPPSTMKIVLSARELANDRGSAGWKQRLDWNTGKQASAIELNTLDKTGIANVLQSIGLPNVASEIVDRLLLLTEGEPLLVQLYAEDISIIVKKKGGIDIEDLSDLKPGFSAFFFRWLELQRHAWKDEGHAINEAELDAILAVFACAFGPLQAEHFISIVCKISGTPRPNSTVNFLRPIRRFITGSGTLESGYVLNHPKLGQYLREEYLDGPIIQNIHQEFVNWGRSVILETKTERRENHDVPPYLLQYYTQHLAITHGTVDDYASLLTNGWRLAWERYEGGYRGFCANVQSVLSRLGSTEQYLPTIAEATRIRVRAALCLASVQSTGSNCPCELLALALDEGLITLRQATHYIELQVPENQSQFHAAIFKHFNEDQIDDAIEAIYKTLDTGNRAQFLISILSYIEGSRRNEVIADIFAMIMKVDDPLQRSSHMVNLASYGDVEYLNIAFDEIISAPHTSENITSFAIYFAKLHSYFERAGDLQKADDAFKHCISYLEEATDIFAKSNALFELSKFFSIDIIQPFADKWIQISEKLTIDLRKKAGPGPYQFDMAHRVSIALKIQSGLMLLSAKKLSGTDYDEQLTRMLKLLNTIQDDMDRVRILVDHLPLIREESKLRIIELCFKDSLELRSGNNRTHTLMTLARNTSYPLRSDIAREALTNSRLIEDDYSRGITLVALFSCLSPEDKQRELPIVVTAINQVTYCLRQGSLLIELATHMAEHTQQFFESGISLISMASELRDGTIELINVVDKLPSSLKRSVFRRCFDDLIAGSGFFAGFSMARLAEKTEDLWTKNDLDAAFRFYLTLSEQRERGFLLHALVPFAMRFGRTDILKIALEENIGQKDVSLRIQGMAKIIPYLKNIKSDSDSLAEIWNLAMGVESRNDKAVALVQLVPLLSIKERKANWHEAKSAVLVADNNWQLLKDLSNCCLDEAEKAELLDAAFVSAENSPPASLVPLHREVSEKLRVCDRVTGQSGIIRSTLLNEVARMSPVFSSLGGSELVRQIMHEILENAEWWP